MVKRGIQMDNEEGVGRSKRPKYDTSPIDEDDTSPIDEYGISPIDEDIEVSVHYRLYLALHLLIVWYSS